MTIHNIESNNSTIREMFIKDQVGKAVVHSISAIGAKTFMEYDQVIPAMYGEMALNETHNGVIYGGLVQQYVKGGFKSLDTIAEVYRRLGIDFIYIDDDSRVGGLKNGKRRKAIKKERKRGFEAIEHLSELGVRVAGINYKDMDRYHINEKGTLCRIH